MQVVSKEGTGDSINRVGSRETGAACWGNIQTVDSADEEAPETQEQQQHAGGT